MVIVSLEWKKKKEKNWHQPPGERGGKEELLVVGQGSSQSKEEGWERDVCFQWEGCL